MDVWLFQGGLSVGFFVLLLPVAFAPLVARVYDRFGYAAPAPTALALLTGLYACALVAFTTFPLPQEDAGFCRSRNRFDYWQLVPGAALHDIGGALDASGLHALTGGTVLQVLFNVVFFVPLGFLMAYWARRRLVVALGLGLLVSLVIELTQGTALWGAYRCPYRVADVDDLVTNTMGAGLGWLVGRGLSSVLPYREPARRADPGPPTVRRRVTAATIDLVVWLLVSAVAQVVVNAIALGTGRDVDSVGGARAVASVLVAVTLLLVVPLVRRDRASIGQACVHLALARSADEQAASDASTPAPRPARARAVVVRFVLRWLPIVAPTSGWVAVLVVCVELATVAVRPDRRTLTQVLGGSRSVTQEALGTRRSREDSGRSGMPVP